MTEPVFSIIIPLFNREELVRETLDSLLIQTFSDWESLVVDDGSTDRSRETVSEYAQRDSRIRLLERPADRLKGPSSSKNFGFEHARGTLIYYLDSDDLLEKHFCENAVKTFAANPSADFIGVQCIPFSGDSQEAASKTYPREFPDGDIRSHYLEKTLWVQTETFCWRKKFLDRFPRHWPEDQRVGEDRVCYYRILTQSCTGVWPSENVQVLHRSGSVSAGVKDQLTPQINRRRDLAAQRVLTAERLIEAFRKSDRLNPVSETLLLDNALFCLRGVLSYNHRDLASRTFSLITQFANETNRPEYIRKAKRYIRLRTLFRFHRIPAVERLVSRTKRLLKGKK